MDVISIDGTEYVKATQLAKRLKYTTDYIGQLCRANKVTSKLVGRTWYVNPESILEHKNTRYIKSGKDEKIKNINALMQISPKRVEPVQRKNNFFQNNSNKFGNDRNNQNFLNYVAWKPAKYEADTDDLYPIIKKTSENPQKINVNLAEASSIKIFGDKKVSNFETDILPEVSLQGKINVVSFGETFDNKAENIDRTEFFKENVEVLEKDVKDKNLIKININEKKLTPSEFVEPKQEYQPKTKVKDPYSYPVEIHAGGSVFANLTSRPIVFAQSKVSVGISDKKAVNSYHWNHYDKKNTKNRLEKLKIISWFLICGFGFLLILSLLVVEKSIFVSGSDYSVSYSLNFTD